MDGRSRRRSGARRWTCLGAIALLAGTIACRSAGDSTREHGIAMPGLVAHPPRAPRYDVEHYAIDLRIDPGARRIAGTCRIRLLAVAGPLEEIDLDLDDLQVTGVGDGRGRPLAFQQGRGVLSVELPRPLPPGETAEVVVAYEGSPRKGLYFVAERDGVPTQVFTQGECEDSRGWFPCADAPDDRATSELRVTLPASWTAVAAGDRIERTVRGGSAIESWRMTTPHPAYLTTLVAGELEVRTSAWDGIPLAYLSEPDLAPLLEPNLGRTGEVLAFLSELTGTRYPYSKYTQTCVANFPYGGMENISATTLTDTALVDERARRDAPKTGLVVHEAAHQWFGDLLTCRDWSHVWLNEGLATYAAWLFQERDQGVDAFRVQVRTAQEAYVAADVGGNRRPVVHDVYRRPMDLFFSGHAYGGAAIRVHLLRTVLGDPAFFRGLRLYVGRNAGRAVVTDDFRLAMEEASGEDLGWFFDTWFAKPGFPEFQTGWRHDERRHLLLLSVDQVQAIGDGTPPEFHLPVDVGILDEDGFRTVRIQIEKRRQIFEIPASREPLFVRFDESSAIPKTLEERKTGEEWLAIARGDPDVNGRREATRVLGRFLAEATQADPRGRLLGALVERLASDASPAVRAVAATALDSVPEPAARDALTKAAFEDGEPQVRCAALAALESFAPDEDLAGLASRVYGEESSWDTMAAAASLLVAARPVGAVEWLRRETARESPQDALRSRLIRVLSKAFGSKAVPVLVGFAVAEGAPEGGRAAAVEELGRVGRGHPEAVSAIGMALESPSWRIRQKAIEALGAQRTPASRSLLQGRYARTALVPELRAIEAALEVASRDG